MVPLFTIYSIYKVLSVKKVLKWLGIVATSLVALVVGLGLLVQWYLLPRDEFNITDVPAAPSYANEDFWASLPTKQDTADLVPVGLGQSNDMEDKQVDVFFVHSTGYVGPGGWNSNMAKTNSEAQSLEYMLSSMASAFNGCCDIYAPIYRQAHLSAFGSADTQSSYQALDLAYQDVASAFDYFLAHQNKGRPFMIVGHSQGSHHALRLIADKIDGTDLRHKMVAAYTIGYWLPLDMFEREFENISLCQSATQTGCIVSYDTYGEGGYLSQGYRHWYSSGWEDTLGKSIACVNPLSWQTNTQKVSADHHKGAFPVEFKRTFLYMLLAKSPEFTYQELESVTQNLTWAQCDKSGVLHIQKQQDNAFSNHFDSQDGSYHVLDFNLFYGNIRANGIERTNAFLSQP